MPTPAEVAETCAKIAELYLDETFGPDCPKHLVEEIRRYAADLAAEKPKRHAQWCQQPNACTCECCIQEAINFGKYFGGTP